MAYKRNMTVVESNYVCCVPQRSYMQHVHAVMLLLHAIAHTPHNAACYCAVAYFLDRTGGKEDTPVPGETDKAIMAHNSIDVSGRLRKIAAPTATDEDQQHDNTQDGDDEDIAPKRAKPAAKGPKPKAKAKPGAKSGAAAKAKDPEPAEPYSSPDECEEINRVATRTTMANVAKKGPNRRPGGVRALQGLMDACEDVPQEE